MDWNGSNWIKMDQNGSTDHLFTSSKTGRFVRYPQMFAVELGMLNAGGCPWEFMKPMCWARMLERDWTLKTWNLPSSKKTALQKNPSLTPGQCWGTPGHPKVETQQNSGFFPLRLRADNSGPKAIGLRVERWAHPWGNCPTHGVQETHPNSF